MTAAKDYQRFAARCLQEARTAADPQHRTFLVEMAQAWRKLADQAAAAKRAQTDTPFAEPDRGD